MLEPVTGFGQLAAYLLVLLPERFGVAMVDGYLVGVLAVKVVVALGQLAGAHLPGMLVRLALTPPGLLAVKLGYGQGIAP